MPDPQTPTPRVVYLAPSYYSVTPAVREVDRETECYVYLAGREYPRRVDRSDAHRTPADAYRAALADADREIRRFEEQVTQLAKERAALAAAALAAGIEVTP